MVQHFDVKSVISPNVAITLLCLHHSSNHKNLHGIYHTAQIKKLIGVKAEREVKVPHTLSAEFNEWNITVTTVINQANTHSPCPHLATQTKEH